MKKLSAFLIKNRYLVLGLTAVICVLSVIGTLVLINSDRINSDFFQYLPAESDTAKGMGFLQENFDIQGDAMLVIEGDEQDAELAEKLDGLSQLPGVTQMLWAGSIEEMSTLGDNPLVAAVLESDIDTAEILSFLKAPIDPEDPNTKYNYVVVFMLSYPPSTQAAFDTLAQIEAEFADRNYATTGMTAAGEEMLTNMMNELPKMLIFGFIAVLIVLFLFMSSYMEPIILIITLGIAILINMATNLIFDSICIVSFACSAILQLGITMDYAIFYMHIYEEERHSGDRDFATRATLPRASRAIIGSCLTTMFGFAALFVMQFSIGADIAKVIVKGVAISLLTIIFVQPCLTYCLDKKLDSWRHKQLKLPYDKASSFVVSKRKLLLVAAAVLVVPSILGSNAVSLSYLKFLQPEENPTSQTIMAEQVGNQLILALPLETVNGKTHQDFIAQLKEEERVGSIMSMFTVVETPVDRLESLLNIVGEQSPFNTMFRKVDGKWYTLYTIAIEGDPEDDRAAQIYTSINATAQEYFGEAYPLGALSCINDMKATMGDDILMVSLLSIIAIFILIAFLFKSPGKAFVMVFIIQLGIWLNFSISYLFGTQINFMVYIIISSIQLGCTVDYAILISNTFEAIKGDFPDKAHAAKKAIKDSVPAVMTSALIIMTACMACFVVSGNTVVKEITWLMTRGAFISLFLVCTVLPGALCYYDKFSEWEHKLVQLLFKRKKGNKEAE